MRRRAAYLIPLLLLCISFGTALYHPSVALADNGYNYTDTKGTAISGPVKCDNNNVHTFVSNGGGGVYYWQSPGGHVCRAELQTADKKYDGQSTSGTLTSCSGPRCGIRTGPDKVAIAKPVANAVGAWIDHSTISYNGAVYFDNAIDGNLSYQLQADSCNKKASNIDQFSQDGGHAGSEKNATGSATIASFSIAGNGNSQCIEQDQTISFASAGNFNTYFKWDDAGTISSTDAQSGGGSGSLIFGRDDTIKTLFTDDGSGKATDASCASTMTAGPGATTGTLKLGTKDGRNTNGAWLSSINNATYVADGKGCKFATISNIHIEDPVVAGGGKASASAAGSSGVAGNGPHAGASNGSNANCESSGFSLSWIMCPIINGLADTVDGIYQNIIKPLLVTRPIDFSSSDPSHLYTVWSNFRTLGDIFLIIALLVIVFGQSIGGGLIDAYSAKKILPRLLIAAIAINLSIYLVALMVDFTNIVGDGVAGLIQAPFSQAGDFKLTLNGGTSGIAGIGLGSFVVGIAWSAFAGGAFIQFLLLFILLPALLTFVAILATVIIRRGLILFLVIISPVAFALYCLPNTEQYFKKWWELLFKTLMVYPIIAVIFAIANVLSVTINLAGKTGRVTDTLSGLISIAALLIPLFLIPFSFKLAGGALGSLHDTFTNGRKRMHEGVKGKANDPDSLRNRTRRNFASRNAENGLSSRGIGATLNPKNAFSRAKRNAARQTAKDQYQAVYGKQGMGAATYETYQQDSHVTGDLAKYGSRTASQQAIENDIANGVFARGSEKHQQRLYSSSAADRIGRSSAMRRRALMNPATIGYEFQPGEAGFNQANTVMNELSGGDAARKASLMNEFQSVAKSQAGRTDLAAATDNGDYNGYKAWTQVGMYQHGNGKASAIEGSAQYFKGLHARAVRGALTQQDIDNFKTSEGAFEAVGTFTRELNNMGDGATGAVRDMANEQEAEMYSHGQSLGGRGNNLKIFTNSSEKVKKAARGYDREEAARLQRDGR